MSCVETRIITVKEDEISSSEELFLVSNEKTECKDSLDLSDDVKGAVAEILVKMLK